MARFKWVGGWGVKNGLNKTGEKNNNWLLRDGHES